VIFPSNAYGLENLIACPKVMLRPCLVNKECSYPRLKFKNGMRRWKKMLITIGVIGFPSFFFLSLENKNT